MFLPTALSVSIILFAISCLVLAYVNNSKVVFLVTVALLMVSIGMALHLSAYVIAYILLLLFVFAKYISAFNVTNGERRW